MSSKSKGANGYVFFWGGDPNKSGDKAVFSNWCDAKFTDENGNLFHNSEQYMMWGKAKLMGDDEIAKAILKQPDARKVKAMGRKVRNWNQELWEKEAKNVVRRGCMLKFRQNRKMKAILLDTGNKTLVEAAPNDSIWGIGLDEAAARRVPEEDWPGTNWLGQVLMDVRDALRAEDLADADNATAARTDE